MYAYQAHTDLTRLFTPLHASSRLRQVVQLFGCSGFSLTELPSNADALLTERCHRTLGTLCPPSLVLEERRMHSAHQLRTPAKLQSDKSQNNKMAPIQSKYGFLPNAT